jgi:phenylpropionate dioxygenase-like ring-hydroxylating dioxygenase large terminal subunit
MKEAVKLITLKTPSGPPSFEEAQNRRQKARAAGMNPDYWYAVEWDKNIKRGEVKEVVFWKQSIALFRGQDGKLSAIENRCAHRQLKLTEGHVIGCQLVCPYHGWQYDANGKCAHIPHELFGNKMPEFKLRDYPTQVKFGLVWIFPGDAKLAPERKIPDIPELDGRDPWGLIPVDITVQGHHSMVMDNVSDFTHAYLHRKYRPFWDAKLTKLEVKGDCVELEYDTVVGGGGLTAHFVNRQNADTNRIKLAYEYPYQRSNTDDHIKHWCFVTPIDEQTTRAIFLFYFAHDLVKIPGLGAVRLPGWFLRQVIMPLAKRLHVEPLIAEDGYAVRVEQDGYNRHFDKPIAELNPAVHEFQALTIRKWEEHLAKARQ